MDKTVIPKAKRLPLLLGKVLPFAAPQCQTAPGGKAVGRAGSDQDPPHCGGS